MRFQRYPRYHFTRTWRKVLAAERNLRRQREALPLFAEMIREVQPSVDEIMAERERRWIDSEKADRARRAQQWREARSCIASLCPEARKVVTARWNSGIYPATPVYLFYLIRTVSKETA
jgi:hypothetical protein